MSKVIVKSIVAARAAVLWRACIALAIAGASVSTGGASAAQIAAEAAQKPKPALQLESPVGLVDGPQFDVPPQDDPAATQLGLPLPDVFPVPIDPPLAGGLEYGDAPDSVGPNMTAYPGVQANFPTLQPSNGPHHRQPDNVYLGEDVTRDRQVDEDGMPNLMPAANIANLDAMDDGWLDAATEPFVNCATTILTVRVSTAAGVNPPAQLLLNTWFDGNRDGDWNDIAQCPNQQPGFEWIVQNYAFAPPPAGTSVDLNIPTQRVMNNNARPRAWVRFTLGETPALPGVQGDNPRPNGSYPARMDWGETEDYLWIQPQQPGGPDAPPAAAREAAVNTRQWTMHRVDNATHPDAICNDGSAPTFYTRPGDGGNTNKWVVFFKGGGSCYDEASCRERGPMLTSGDYWATNIDLNTAGTLDGGQDGLLSQNPAHNPDFHDWNALYMAYCSSDSWAGTSTTPVVFQQNGVTRTFNFRGHHIVNAIMDAATDAAVITSGNTLSNASQILFFGWSAGDVGLHNNIDRLAARFSGIDVRAVGDAAITPYNPPALDARAQQMRADKFAAYQPVYDESCINANVIDDNACGEPDTLIEGGYISTPMFYRQAQFDYASLENMGLWPPLDHAVHTAEFARQVRGIMLPRSGAFSPLNSQHIGTTNSDFFAYNIITGGQPYTMATVLGNWYFNRPGPKVVVEQPMIRKRAITAGPLNVGDEFDYQIDIVRNSGAVAASTAPTVGFVDVLPPMLDFVRGVSFTQVGATSPLTGPLHQPGMGGPRGRVMWYGTLADGGTLSARFRVRLLACPADGIVNIARFMVDGGMQWDEAHTPVACVPPAPPVITATKQLLDGDALAAFLPGALIEPEGLFWGITLHATGVNGRLPARIQDALPRGMIALNARASDGEVQISEGGRIVNWRGLLSAADGDVKLIVRARAHLPDVCKHVLRNVARWGVRLHDGRLLAGESNVAVYQPPCNDLGDAPDSSNHAAAAMTAYPGVPAGFPTVFDSPAGAPRGPRHLLPMPLHLGPSVSFEAEADLGPDQDPVNNLQPAANIANRDRADNGMAAPPVFANCQANVFPVQIEVLPGLGITLPNVAYINVWLDSNSDGDWEDSANCNGVPAREHIVIDQMVNLPALGAGLHNVAVTAPLVRKPAGPAWLRVTLSDRPSNKTLPAGCAGAACTFGDGRGHNQPFALGETEDYRLPAPPAGGPDDVDVLARVNVPAPDGAVSIRMQHNEDDTYSIQATLENDGDLALGLGTAVVTLSPNLRIVNTSCSSDTACSSTISNDQSAGLSLFPFTPGTEGRITLRARVLPGIASGDALTATATAVIGAGAPGNNAVTARATWIGERPARLTAPRTGTSNHTGHTLSGRARPNRDISVLNRVDGGPPTVLGETTSTGFGTWSLGVNLGEGVNRLGAFNNGPALARADAANDVNAVSLSESRARVTVDTRLPYDPVSLSAINLADSSGELTTGPLDEAGWKISSQAGKTVTVKLNFIPNTRGVIYYEGAAINMADQGAGLRAAEIVIGGESGSILICAERGAEYTRCMSGEVDVLEPGLVYDIAQGELAPIRNATVTLEVLNGAMFEPWTPDNGGTPNPQRTNNAGKYVLVPPAGIYRLVVEKAGYQTFTTVPFATDGGSIAEHIGLTPEVAPARAAAQTHVVRITDAGPQPTTLRIRPGDAVRFEVSSLGLHHVTGGDGANAFDTGALLAGESHVRSFASKGSVLYGDALNPAQQALILIDEFPPAGQRVMLPMVMR